MCLGLSKNTSSGSTEAFVIIENIFICILNTFLSNLNGLTCVKIVNSKPRSKNIMCHDISVFLCSHQDFSLNLLRPSINLSFLCPGLESVAGGGHGRGH